MSKHEKNADISETIIRRCFAESLLSIVVSLNHCSFVTGMMKDSHQPRAVDDSIDKRKWAEKMSVTIYSASPTNGHSLREYVNLKTESGRHVKRVWSKKEGSEEEW